jgi:hypothetical protein
MKGYDDVVYNHKFSILHLENTRYQSTIRRQHQKVITSFDLNLLDMDIVK